MAKTMPSRPFQSPMEFGLEQANLLFFLSCFCSHGSVCLIHLQGAEFVVPDGVNIDQAEYPTINVLTYRHGDCSTLAAVVLPASE
ncbi:hypothetical protein CVT26_011501 [Gymnopilus dilepis]|uniref:Uncharacterized protein n=1 Tax=Gymnopilus dilepis TaxID=231916 RepID=A0A409VXR7_9AGAR|nr:hypothetical protein CVT26_011501 [Gymnopilus dilepis]